MYNRHASTPTRLEHSCIRVGLWLWGMQPLSKETMMPADHDEQRADVPWSPANMELVWTRANMVLLTSKHQIISRLLTSKHWVAFDHEQTIITSHDGSLFFSNKSNNAPYKLLDPKVLQSRQVLLLRSMSYHMVLFTRALLVNQDLLIIWFVKIKNRGIHGFLGPSWVLTTMPPRNTVSYTHLTLPTKA